VKGGGSPLLSLPLFLCGLPNLGDIIELTGFVYVDFRRNNQVVHVRLDYVVYVATQGYHLLFTSVNTRDPLILKKLKKPSRIRVKVLAFIMDLETGKLPSTAKLEIHLNSDRA